MAQTEPFFPRSSRTLWGRDLDHMISDNDTKQTIAIGQDNIIILIRNQCYLMHSFRVGQQKYISITMLNE